MKVKAFIASVVVAAGSLLWALMATAAPVNINTATADEIAERLDGLGPIKAELIVEYRSKQPGGKIQSKEDLKNVKGISERTYDSIKDDIVIDGVVEPEVSPLEVGS